MTLVWTIEPKCSCHVGSLSLEDTECLHEACCTYRRKSNNVETDIAVWMIKLMSFLIFRKAEMHSITIQVQKWKLCFIKTTLRFYQPLQG